MISTESDMTYFVSLKLCFFSLLFAVMKYFGPGDRNGVSEGNFTPEQVEYFFFKCKIVFLNIYFFHTLNTWSLRIEAHKMGGHAD